MTSTIRPPLEDPTYVPQHPPTPGGGIPAVVEKWGPKSQLRWFTRFYGQLRPASRVQWDRYYCESELHRGFCCPSCVEDQGTEWAFDSLDDDGVHRCCCITLRDEP